MAAVESEWDRRLNNLLDDLENSAADGATGRGGAPGILNSSQVSSRVDGYCETSSSSSTKKISSSNNNIAGGGVGFGNNASVIKSTSNNNNNNTISTYDREEDIGADSMLKDLNSALNASSNYIETHRTVGGGPNGVTREYHEYRTYSSSGGTGETGGTPGNDFDLEKSVQHMMPSSSLANHGNLSPLNSANMVSSMQQQKSSSSSSSYNQSFSTYKIQSNTYNESSVEHHHQQQQQERPGSRLKQNIDELDTLLYDLNHARKMSDAGADYTASSITPGNLSSDDYSFNEGHQGHVKKTVHSFNTTEYNSSLDAKPPSPSPRRRAPSGQQPLSSPASVRKVSPSPVPNHSRHVTTSSTSSVINNNNNYSLSSSKIDEYKSGGGPTYRNSPVTVSGDPGTPNGVSYYTKYHSTHSHQSQHSGPKSFPNSGRNTPVLPTGSTPSNQQPPKRVDDLMTELSEFDPSIQPTGFVEPNPPNKTVHSTYKHDDDDLEHFHRDPSPIRMTNKSGPAVYYPPGEMFSSGVNGGETTLDSSTAPLNVSSSQQSGSLAGKGRAKGEWAAKDKGKFSESDTKQGAAVVPICLPLCCAAPCVIL